MIDSGTITQSRPNVIARIAPKNGVRAQSLVAQIGNLLYRRMVFGKALAVRRRWEFVETSRIANPRQSNRRPENLLSSPPAPT
jgi:hypothetical protein